MTAAELAEVVAKHGEWLRSGGRSGARANLAGAAGGGIPAEVRE